MAISTGAALLGSAIIGGGASILGGKSQSKAAGKAADVSLQVAKENNALAKGIYDENKATLAPFVGAGVNATGRMNDILAQGPTGLNPLSSEFLARMDPGSFSDYREGSGYDFRLNEGLNAIGTNFAARGAWQSGAAGKELMKYGQNIASAERQNYMNELARYTGYSDDFANRERAYVNDRTDNYTGLVAGQQGVGLNAAAAQAGVGNNYVSNVSANNNSAGTAQANALLAKGNAQASAYSGVANALGQAAGYYAMPSSAYNKNPYGLYGVAGGGLPG